MSEVSGLVQKALQEINDKAERTTEDRVKHLVNKIIAIKESIKQGEALLIEHHAELNALQMPKPVTLDLA